jgi:hypothetical protein
LFKRADDVENIHWGRGPSVLIGISVRRLWPPAVNRKRAWLLSPSKTRTAHTITSCSSGATTTSSHKTASWPVKPTASGANVDTLVLVYRVTLPTYVPPGRFDRFELVGRIFGHENDDRH